MPTATPLASDATDHGYILQNVAIAFIVLDVAFVGLRIYTRAMKGTRAQLNDYLVLLGLLFNIGLAIEAILLYRMANIGHHLAWVKKHEPPSLITYAKIQVSFEFTYVLGFTFPKLAILCLYLNIFVEPSHRRTCFVFIGLVCATGISIIVACAVQCIPLAYLWDKKGHPGGHCIAANSLWQWSTLPNIIVDVGMFVLPFPALSKLHLPTKDKIGLGVTFATGSIGIFSCIARMIVLFRTSRADSTWNAVSFGCLTMLEASTYLMAACFPLYRPLFQAARKQIGQTIGSSRTGGSRGTMKGVDSELQSIRKTGFSDSGFERLEDGSQKTVVSSRTHEVDNYRFEEASSIDSGYDRSSRPEIRVKKEFLVASVEDRR